ncbi:MAG: EamA family transporter [Omnitrophica WOR_2 bacterium]
MPSANILGIVFALTSAIVWGSGDFTGGYATRRQSQYSVLALAAFSGLVFLVIAVMVRHESFPSSRGIAWAMLGGAAGALGIAAFYRALSMGYTATVAPTAAVIGAGFPVVFSIFSEGFPAPARVAGFGLALAGIWLVSRAPGSTGGISRQGFVLACLAGIGFGGFLTCLGQVEPGKVFTPLVIARSLTLVTGLLLVRLNRLPLPSPASNPLALAAGMLDAGGNLFYVLARQFTRLDTAAVLSSLYPASTVILASLVLREKTSRSQWAGLMICLAAIALITNAAMK